MSEKTSKRQQTLTEMFAKQKKKNIKENTENKNDDAQIDDSDEPISSRTRAKKRKHDEEENNDHQKKKRKTLEEEEESKTNQSTSKKTNNLKRKRDEIETNRENTDQSDSQIDISESVESDEPPKKKRGRPKSGEIRSEEDTTPRKRGRPRKGEVKSKKKSAIRPKDRPGYKYVKKPKPDTRIIRHFINSDSDKTPIELHIPKWKPHVLEVSSSPISQKDPKTMNIKIKNVEEQISVPPNSSTKLSDDCVFMNLGGPIWVMDWCLTNEDDDQYAAICVHPEQFHVETVKYTGTNFIQIWCMGKLQKDNFSAPRLAMKIQHDHGFVWQAKWCPANCTEVYNEGNVKRRLGILACSFSDGKFGIFVVPHPDDYKTNDGSIPVLKLKCYEYEIPDEPMYAVQWSPDLQILIFGSHLGNGFLYKVNADAKDDNILTAMTTVTHGSFIRSFSWCKTAPQYFIGSGNDGNVCLWDLNDCYEPLYNVPSGKSFAPETIWPDKTNMFIVTSHDGIVKQMDTKEDQFSSAIEDKYPIWGVSNMSSNSCIAYSTAGGIVALHSMSAEGLLKERKKKIDYQFNVHLVEMSIKKQDSKDVVELVLPFHPGAEPKHKTTKEKKKSKKKELKLIPDERIALHTVRFHPSVNEKLRNWLLIGGQYGLVILLKAPNKHSL